MENVSFYKKDCVYVVGKEGLGRKAEVSS
jgi:hypothetical protein